MKWLLEGLPSSLKRNAEVHLAWVLAALMIAVVVAGCGKAAEASESEVPTIGQKIGEFSHNGGSTAVRVTGDTERVGQVDVQYAECSRKDNFCKKTGRSLAEKAPVKVVPLRFLPQELARIAEKAKERKRIRTTPEDFTYSLKYFLPKE